VAILWDPIAESDHLFLGGTSSVRTHVSSFTFLFSREGLFDALKHFKQRENTLGCSSPHEFVLVLPVPWDHFLDVACQVHIVEWLQDLGQFGRAIREEEAGQ
jgi:hypothetical protein